MPLLFIRSKIRFSHDETHICADIDQRYIKIASSSIVLCYTVIVEKRNPIQPRGYKTVSKLNSTEQEIYPAYKC